MKGHIRERSPGRWAIIIEIRDPETGKRKRKWHSFKGGKREAQIECSRLISELSGGVYIEIRDPETGKRKRKWHSFKGGKREAQIECSRLISELSGGVYIDPTRLTLSAFLDRWIRA